MQEELDNGIEAGVAAAIGASDGALSATCCTAISVEERRRAASVDAAGKHEPHLRENGIPADVLAKLLPGDDVLELEAPTVVGGLGYCFVKRAFDVCSTGVALVVLAIPMAIIAAKIKHESPGPAIYAQERVGRDGRLFKVYKFRSMYMDAEERGARWAEGDDPRVTPFGRIMRKTRVASVIIGTPGDGEPTKSFSHPANSSLDLQLCERRPELASHAEKHYNSCHFLSADLFRGLLGGEKGLAAGVFEKLADAFRAECTRLCWAVAA